MKIYNDENVTIIEDDNGTINVTPYDSIFIRSNGTDMSITTGFGLVRSVDNITEVLDKDDTPYTDITNFLTEIRVPIPDSGGGGTPIPSNLLSYDKLILACWSTNTQTPSAAETPMIINCNTVAYIDTTYLEMLTSGVIRVKIPIKIQSSFSANVNRQGSQGVSTSYGRICQNNVQQGGSLESSLDGSQDKQPLIDTSYFNCTTNDEIKYEFYNEGNNRGRLESTLPSLYPAWNPVYSSAIVMRTNDGLI